MKKDTARREKNMADVYREYEWFMKRADETNCLHCRHRAGMELTSYFYFINNESLVTTRTTA